ncbi:hypothetical protein [Opitutus terrae]|uniref:Glycosyl transferase family 8 n=1 Tax=Opitutus terrae (strain DSM 11246 / JCM 15787 / PB90-1) TaxID=452637 RepID=B1ZVW9_OPITP|nr:hypothetical protein [Opitutus terrae]ACB75055.1 hypothetical protein Oter_1771 [Opitutus terrae PB90-1]
MNHYCTYFDRGFLAQGLAMWRSLATNDPDSVLWVLALDDFTAEVLRNVGGTWLRVILLRELEHDDEMLAAAKANRSRIEYYFTLSPCWPRWLLARRREIDRLTYVDADLFFFGDPGVLFEEMDARGASVAITAHRFPTWLQHYQQHGCFNVGILSWRRDAAGLGCLEDWRQRCLEWCYDRLEPDRYADQKYLEQWPAMLGPRLLVLEHPGVNLAPWNWAGHTVHVGPAASRRPARGASRRGTEASPVSIDGHPLLVFHFARFRPIRGTWWWQSGQLDYGVMPWRLRQAVYGPYWEALCAARSEIRQRRPDFDFPRGTRLGREFWHALPLRLIFGSDWLRIGRIFVSGRAGVGRWSGRVLAALRRLR